MSVLTLLIAFLMITLIFNALLTGNIVITGKDAEASYFSKNHSLLIYWCALIFESVILFFAVYGNLKLRKYLKEKND